MASRCDIAGSKAASSFIPSVRTASTRAEASAARIRPLQSGKDRMSFGPAERSEIGLSGLSGPAEMLLEECECSDAIDCVRAFEEFDLRAGGDPETRIKPADFRV